MIQRFLRIVSVILCIVLLPCSVLAQDYDPAMFRELHWRLIGPFRGGRTVAISGVPGQQNVFYMAPNNGGVWKSTDYGRTWTPIFDDQPTGSIGALAVAPSDPNTIYVGSGEGLRRPDLSVGNGVYKSSDGGRTWQHLDLQDAQQIASLQPALAVDASAVPGGLDGNTVHLENELMQMNQNGMTNALETQLVSKARPKIT